MTQIPPSTLLSAPSTNTRTSCPRYASNEVANSNLSVLPLPPLLHYSMLSVSASSAQDVADAASGSLENVEKVPEGEDVEAIKGKLGRAACAPFLSLVTLLSPFCFCSVRT